jgi:hypothetical protein
VRANTPAGTAGTVSVQVTNPDTQSATLNSAFTYTLPAPTVTSVSPTSGTTAGGTTITINGTNFVSGATVRVGGTSATGVTFLSATQVRANTPAGTAGAKSVQVTNPDTQSATLASAFTHVAPAPTVTSVSPTSGTTAGGTTITINGTNFVSGATVRVGSTSATGVTFLSATQVRANTPAGSAGVTSVQVTNPDTQSATLNSAFTYVAPAPTVTSVSPNTGTTLGGTTITINGTNFVSGATVRVAGTSATGVTFLSATQVRANTPAGTAGAASIQVTNPDTQSATLASAFTYVTPTAPAPSLTTVSPSTGPAAGGTLITLGGSNFVSGATVRVNGVLATGVTFVSAAQLRATTPAGSGLASVQVTNPDAQVATLSNVFTYQSAAPTISSVSPASGPTTGGSVLTVIGTGFVNGATVRVGSTAAASVTFVSATEVRATTPAGSAGAVAVQLTNPDTQSASRGNAFTYTNTAPLVTAVSPASGPIAGGTLITITGTNFVQGSGAAVRIGGIVAAGLTYVNATTLRVQTPAGTVGAKAVQVANPDSQSAALANGFTYTDASSGDTDGDGLPDAWETQFGVNPNVATGADGAAGDPDADGVSNADERTAGTHPRGLYQRYLAEGATNGFFNTRFAVANPQTVEAKVLLTFVDAEGRTTRRMLPVPARSRRTVDSATVSELAGMSFATGLDSDQLVVMDRLMTWDGGAYGGHAETSVPQPSTVWYLAEGATGGPFDLFYLIQNPGNATADVEIRYLRSAGQAPITKYYAVGPGSRFTVYVNREDQGLKQTDVSAVVTSRNGVPVIVERSMYLTTARGAFKGGHNSAGVTAPATSWFLAEGATGSFSMYVLVANPGNQAAAVRVTFLLENGAPVVKTYNVAANSRYTIDVSGQDKALREASMAVRVESTNGQPIIVERTMWWPLHGGGWTEGHNAFGTTSTGPRWLVAEGEQGGARSASTYVLIANTSAANASVKATVLFEDGAEQSAMVTVPASRRYTIDIGSVFPSAVNKRFSVMIESQNPTTAGSLVVERSMYWNTSTELWGAGTDSLATKLP